MNEPFETMMEMRAAFMVSPAGESDPILRKAHFLKPIENTVNGSPLASTLFPPIFEPKDCPLLLKFNGLRCSRKWSTWVDTLRPKYESLWNKVGIYEAIMSTKSRILKNRHLILGVAETWCSKTKSFVFPWGEATITLEDVMVLGGYPVLGDPVFAALMNKEMKETEEKLVLARKIPWRTKKRKASASEWMGHFINSGNEIEHEAFLAAWLSLFVFRSNNLLVKTAVFPIAVHLARGKQIALAPAVLASIYRDLGLLKRTIVGMRKNALVGNEMLQITLESPFYLVQVWVWERFKNLQPQPNLINNCDPILHRWHKVRALEVDNVRLALDLAQEHFLWRPYVRHAGRCRLFYAEKEIFVPVDTNLNYELVSSVVCWRVSELVGLGCCGCFIEQYLPHRVAMQFGFDQDVPGSVARFNETKDIAWGHYYRPISCMNLYFPSRLFEADVTTQYAWWWKHSVLGHEDPVRSIVQRKRSARPSRAKKSGNDAAVPPGFLPKRLKTVITSGNCVQNGLKAKHYVDSDIPTTFPPKYNTWNPSNSIEHCKPILEESKPGDMTHNMGNVIAYECKHLSNHCSSFSTADFEAFNNILPLVEQVRKDNIQPSTEALVENFEYVNWSKESSIDCDRVSIKAIQDEGKVWAPDTNAAELEERIRRLERVFTKLKAARFGQS